MAAFLDLGRRPSEALRHRARGVGAEEEITESSTPQICDPSTGEMVGTIVDDVTPLAKAPEVTLPVVAWVMIEMGCRRDDPGLAHRHGFLDVRPGAPPATMIAPRALPGVEPPAVRQAANGLTVRPAAAFADAASALEAHPAAD